MALGIPRFSEAGEMMSLHHESVDHPISPPETDFEEFERSRTEIHNKERLRIPRDPGLPTDYEIAEHNVSHVDYKSWCKHCVRGRGREILHRRLKERERMRPMVSWDYCFP